jgi:diguanylate cyclase (GGDEF)-like protein
MREVRDVDVGGGRQVTDSNERGETRRLDPAVLRRRLCDPMVLTLALTLAMGGCGAALALAAPGAALLPGPTGGAAALALMALVAAFFLTELGQALIEFRRQAYSFSLSGIPMLLGLLYFPPQHLIAARVLAAVAAFVVQRVAPQKLAFNSASYLLDTALVVAVAHLLMADPSTLSAGVAGHAYVALAGVDLLMSALVLVVIRLNDGPVTRTDAVDVLLPAAGFVALNTAIGVLCALLLGDGALGLVLLVTFVAVTAVVYRGYLVLRRRHQSLQVVQQFIEDSAGTGTVPERAGRLLDEIRDLVRATRVELTLHNANGDVEVRVLSDADQAAVVVPHGVRRATDRALSDGLPAEAGLLSAKSTNPAHRRWLREHGARDAAVVSLRRGGAGATLIAIDRMGDATSFSTDDLALLQALAGHLTVSLRNTQLLERLRHDATHDVLTGLANRALLTKRLHDALAAPAPAPRPAVLLLDLNRFKEVNDALGHHVGDQLLQVVAARLIALDEPDATVARLGGDEFALLLPHAGSVAVAVAVAKRVAASLQAPVDLPEVTISTEASIGVALADAERSDADLLRQADTAMYAAKGTGEAVTIYSPALDAGLAERLELLAELHLALERDELELHYQPKLDLDFGVITSVEALVRWTHPRLGPLAPDVFIPLAESTGLIEELTHVVLAKALRQCRAWQDAGLELTVAVNVSARNVLNADLPDQVAAALVEAGLPAQKLILEITESSVMGDPERTVPTLERLAAIGVTLSLDDFGTGYSSLSYLQRLPVREVKIDRSFITGLSDGDASPASVILVRSIIGLGASLGLRIVAEGVETAAELSQLRDLGCDIVQGYYIARPAPAAELPACLRRAEHRLTAAPLR